LIGIIGAMEVLFVPGFMQPAEAWGKVAELLPERYPSVFIAHAAHTYERRLDEIAAAGEGRVVCGYSLGGRLALRAAVREPDRYAGLVTVGASAGIEAPATRSARAEADAKLAAWIETQPIATIVDVWERQPLFAEQSDAVVAAQREGRLAQDPRDLALILRTAGQGVLDPVWDRLGSLALPVLALAGTLDERYAAYARRIAKAVPNGRAAVIENSGHAPQLQRPGDVARELVTFLDQHFG
jgi:2-succinyl-6-hydroxy-2,4-cyclohexadiene-1-carboxylate synthase